MEEDVDNLIFTLNRDFNNILNVEAYSREGSRIDEWKTCAKNYFLWKILQRNV